MNSVEAELFFLKQRELIAAEFIPDYAVFTVDLSGIISGWSGGAERMLGLPEITAIGQPFSRLLSPNGETQSADALLTQARVEGLAVQETMFRRNSDENFPGSSTLSVIQGIHGQPTGYVIVLRDNTDREASKTALKQAKRSAEIANEMRDLFLSKVSHELRTPLSAILLWLSLIEDLSTVDPAQLDESIRSIKQSAEEQHQLIETLVDTYRVIAGNFTLSPSEVDLAALIGVAMERLRPAATEKNITIEKSIDDTIQPIQVDGRRISQTINLIFDNALKFTSSGGSIRLELHSSSNAVEISVTDSGIGISGELLPHIFDRFSNIVDEPSKIHGFGLGLAVARQLVNRHRGRIIATSDGPGKGSQFTIVLPRT